ncbi:hypothetical protein CPC08DRAFT_821927 [Agrocybe pediades]|nr:hypothetical protein CPC08DRAFT_821927 [Agrocybe pediades]
MPPQGVLPDLDEIERQALPLLEEASSVTLKIIEALPQVKNNSGARQYLEWLAEDATSLIEMIFRWYKSSPNDASQPAMVLLIQELLGNLEEVLSFVEEQVHTKPLILFIKSKVHVRKAKKYCESMKETMESFHNIFGITSRLSIAAELLKMQRQLAGSHSHPPTYEEADEVNRTEKRRQNEINAKQWEEAQASGDILRKIQCLRAEIELQRRLAVTPEGSTPPQLPVYSSRSGCRSSEIDYRDVGSKFKDANVLVAASFSNEPSSTPVPAPAASKSSKKKSETTDADDEEKGFDKSQVGSWMLGSRCYYLCLDKAWYIGQQKAPSHKVVM